MENTICTEPVKIFSAVEAKWANPVPFAKAEFGMDGDVYFTDGPCVMQLPGGALCMTWSSWGTCGYAIGQAVSESGKVEGPWKQVEEPLFPENGGHGMCFQDFKGQWKYTLHFPNDLFMEKPMFRNVVVTENGISFED